VVFENYDEDVLGDQWVRTALSSSASRALSVALADLDNDGDTDVIAILDDSASPLIWFEQLTNSGEDDGSGTVVLSKVQFHTPKVLVSTLTTPATGLVVTDMNADGIHDIVVSFKTTLSLFPHVFCFLK
jgi:hypothetical protein